MALAIPSPVHPVRVPFLRRRVEAAGWRTWLSYRENHQRDAAGRLVGIEAIWSAEAEHDDGSAVVCEASSPARAWSDLASSIHTAERRRARRHHRPVQAAGVAAAPVAAE